MGTKLASRLVRKLTKGTIPKSSRPWNWMRGEVYDIDLFFPVQDARKQLHLHGLSLKNVKFIWWLIEEIISCYEKSSLDNLDKLLLQIYDNKLYDGMKLGKLPNPIPLPTLFATTVLHEVSINNKVGALKAGYLMLSFKESQTKMEAKVSIKLFIDHVKEFQPVTKGRKTGGDNRWINQDKTKKRQKKIRELAKDYLKNDGKIPRDFASINARRFDISDRQVRRLIQKLRSKK